MWMSHRYLEITDKTLFLYVFGHFFLANTKKLKIKQIFVVALFSLYYDKQYIVDGFWEMGSVNGPQMDHQNDAKRW